MRELANAAFGGMQAHLQRIEGKHVPLRDRQLAVEREWIERYIAQSGDNFGEVTCERLAALGAQIDFGPGAERQAAEAIPFRFELPARFIGQRGDQMRFHGC